MTKWATLRKHKGPGPSKERKERGFAESHEKIEKTGTIVLSD